MKKEELKKDLEAMRQELERQHRSLVGQAILSGLGALFVILTLFFLI